LPMDWVLMEICIFNHYNLATGSMAACFPFFILNFLHPTDFMVLYRCYC